MSVARVASAEIAPAPAILSGAAPRWHHGAGLAFAGGVALSPAYVQVFWPVMAWFTLAPLLVACNGQRPRRAALYGLLWGLGLYLPGLYWFAPITVAGYLAMVLYCSAYVAAFGALFAWLAGRFPAGRWLIAPAIWTVLEWIRAWMLSGFPWLFLGHSQADFILLAQVADIGGVYLVSFVVVLVNAALAECLLAWQQGVWQQGTRRRLPLVVGTALGVLGACLIYGLIARAVYTPRDDARRLRVLLVQGNIDTPSRVRLPPAERRQRDIETWKTQLRLTKQELEQELERNGRPPDLIVWSETLLPGTINTNQYWRTQVQKNTDAFRTPLLAGANTEERGPGGKVSHNSACLFLPVVPGEEDAPATQGRLAGRYDKRHLVPFGEFVPWPLKGYFNPLTHSGYTPGKSIAARDMMTISGVRLGVNICYEDAFPGLNRRDVKAGAQLLLNLTNDAWYRGTSQLRQHLAIARFRAIETRRPLVRCTNSGVTAVITPTGALAATLPLEAVAAGTFSVAVPEPARANGGNLSLYTRLGDVLPLVCLLGLICLMGMRALAWMARSRTKPAKPK